MSYRRHVLQFFMHPHQKDAPFSRHVSKARNAKDLHVS